MWNSRMGFYSEDSEDERTKFSRYLRFKRDDLAKKHRNMPFS
jgi:hypothetical protein